MSCILFDKFFIDCLSLSSYKHFFPIEVGVAQSEWHLIFGSTECFAMKQSHVAFLKHILRDPLSECHVAVDQLIILASENLSFRKVIEVYENIESSSNLGTLDTIISKSIMEYLRYPLKD